MSETSEEVQACPECGCPMILGGDGEPLQCINVHEPEEEDEDDDDDV